MRIPKTGEFYRHFKNKLYQIVAVAEHSEDGQQLVIYQALYGEFKVYARPLSMFCSKVDKEKYPDATQEFRFELQSFVKESVEQTETVEAIAVMQEDESEDVIREVAGQEMVQGAAEDELAELDPMLLAFLDAETYAEKLNILTSIHHKITDDMITTMAIACDIEIGEGDLENRFVQLKNCLLTLDKYEITR